MTSTARQRWDGYADRLLRFTEPAADEGFVARYVTTFRAGFLLLVSAQMVHFVFHDRYYLAFERGPLWAARDVGGMVGPLMVFAVFFCAAAALIPRFRGAGLTGLVWVWGFHIFWGFPHVANHAFLMFFALLGLAFFWRDSREEQALALGGLRWLAISVLFWAGVQKVLYGQFFQGEFLAQRIAVDPRYSEVFSWIMGAEVARLRALPADGPFVFQSALGLVLSNVTYMAEIALGLLLLLGPGVRSAAWAGAALLVVAVEVGAREFYFGAAMLQMLVLFAPRKHHRLWAPVFAVVPILLLLASLGLIPGLGIT